MNRFALLGLAVFGLAAASHAQFEGMGWDNSTQEIVGRIGLGGYNHVEVGLGFTFDDRVAASDDKTSFSVSGRYLMALHQWDKLTGYLHLGAYFRDDNNRADAPYFGGGSRASTIALLAAYEPEVQLLQHFTVSTKFGVAVPVTPDVQIRFTGTPVSIVEGFNFRILF